MSDRRSTETVEFRHPFALSGVSGTYPAGIYDVETIEEAVEGLSFLAYRRVSTTMTPRNNDPLTHTRQAIDVEPGDLAASLSNDRLLQNARAAATASRAGSAT